LVAFVVAAANSTRFAVAIVDVAYGAFDALYVVIVVLLMWC